MSVPPDVINKLMKIYELVKRGIDGEQQSAQNLLNQLLKKYDISIDVLTANSEYILYTTNVSTRKYHVVVDMLIMSIAHAMNVLAIKYTDRNEYKFFGKKHDVILADYCLSIAMKYFKRRKQIYYSKLYRKNYSSEERIQKLHDYCTGWVVGINKNIKSLYPNRDKIYELINIYQKFIDKPVTIQNDVVTFYSTNDFEQGNRDGHDDNIFLPISNNNNPNLT